MSYIGDITSSALVVFLIPTALVVGLVGARMHGRALVGLPVVGLLSLLGAEFVNLASGEFQGPAARTTAVASVCTGLAMVLSTSKAPALFLLPLGGIVAGALAFGAGGQVQLVAIVTASVAAVALASIERDRRALVTPARAGGSLLLALLLVGVAAVFAVLFQDQHDGRAAQAPLRQKFVTPITAPRFVSLPQPRTRAREATPEATATAADGAVTRPVTPIAGAVSARSSQLVRWLWVILVVLVVLLGLLAARLVLAWWSWRRYFRRIDRSFPDIVATWLWAMAHLRRLRLEPPPSSSPDLLAAGHLAGVTASLQVLVQRLASVVAPATFGSPTAVEPAVAEESRALSRLLAREAWGIAGAYRRARGRWDFAPRVHAFAPSPKR